MIWEEQSPCSDPKPEDAQAAGKVQNKLKCTFQANPIHIPPEKGCVVSKATGRQTSGLE